MFSNYFKTAWRNLIENKFYSAINIVGLAIGLAVGVLIILWVQDEFSYDAFHKNSSEIFKINSHIGAGQDEQIWEGSPAPLAIFSKQSIPEVVNAVRIDNINVEILFKYGDKKFIQQKRTMVFADSSFFSVFDFKLLMGNPAHPFQDMHSIIFSAAEAKRYFGNDNPLSKVLYTDFGNFTVTGVMEDFPENSTMHYSMILPMAFDADYFAKSGGNGDWKTMDEDLGSFSYQTYLQLDKKASPAKVAGKITQIYQDRKKGDAQNDSFTLQPLTERHLITSDGNTASLQIVRIFMLIAVLILIIASINYVNLSTARSMLRSKEVSIRKIIGAAKYQLFIQFLVESMLLFLFASILAFVLIYIALPFYNTLAGKALVFNLVAGKVWMVIGSTIVGTLLMAGIYPALLLSSFHPLHALKGIFSFGLGKASFRKVLVVTQFIFSIGLIICTIVIGRQMRFLHSKDIGFNKEYVFSFPMKGNMGDHVDAIRTTLLSNPAIQNVATSSNNIVGEFSSTADTYWEGKPANRTFLIHPYFVDQQFIPLLKIKMEGGLNFTGAKSDSANFILNETAIKQAGIKDPIGKSFTLWQTKGTIIGITKDFNYASLKKNIEPIILCYRPQNDLMFIKTTGNDVAKAIEVAKKSWKQYASDYPFDYTFLDDQLYRLYQTDQRTGVLFNAFAIIAILISSLGLLGLVTYTAQVKTKEIGIRKVLGANVASVTYLLTKEFLILVFIAFVIASPVAWIGMNKWLQNYAYRINIGWWVFLLTGALIMLIALLTVGFQAIRAAIANPVKSLRTE